MSAILYARPAAAALDHDLEAADRYRTAGAALPADGPPLLRRAVEDAWQRRRENVFRDLALLYPPAVMDGCYRALASLERPSGLRKIEQP